MAVYSKLLLSAGGGIVSTMQQAEQEKNTATILIGLGGTGIDAIRTIKTQVYSRLKPDDPDAIVLGMDTSDFWELIRLKRAVAATRRIVKTSRPAR